MGKDAVSGPKDAFTNLSYSGRFYLQKGMIYVLLSTSGGEDDLFAIFQDPVDGSLTVTTGVLCALNFHGKPAAFAAVLSKRELSDASVSKMIPSYPLISERTKYAFYDENV